MRRLSYLLKNRSNIKIISKYFKYNFFSSFEKKKRKIFLSKYREFLRSKSLTQDWFSHNSFDWEIVLKNFKDKKFDYLEIGSFEGISAMYVLNFYSKANICCVDSWSEFTTGNEGLPIKIVEENFDKNLSLYQDKFEKFKMKSNEFFSKNKKEFDIIFIDGSHHANDVLEDCLESWKILKKDGIMIIDDYFWTGYENHLFNPIHGINNFFRSFKKYFNVLRVSKKQVFIKKIV